MMWLETFTNIPLIETAMILGVGLLCGLLVEKLLLKRLQALAKKTAWAGDDALLSAVRGYTTLWFVIGASSIAISRVTLEPTTNTWIHNTIVVLLVFSITSALSRLSVTGIKQYIQTSGGSLPSTSILTNVVRLAIYLVGTLVLLQWLGIAITPILTALGVGGLAVALALQDTLSNLFSGIHIVASRFIKPGDYIQIESGEEGTVIDITWRNTMVKNVSNNMIIIPNSTLATSVVTNFNLKKREVISRLTIGIGYDSDLEKVEKKTLSIAKAVLKKLDIDSGSEPSVYFREFGDSAIQMLVIIRAKSSASRFSLTHEFIKAVKVEFEKEGIDMPFPTRTVYTKKA